MIFSPERARDQRRRLEMLIFIEESISMRCPKSARYAGLEAKRLGERIRTHDYTEDDALRAKFPHIDFDQLSTGTGKQTV